MTGKSKQLSFDVEQPKTDNGPVVCLGMTFKNDDERREYFRDELRKKLPELKQIEGFPIGEDEDIIALSDPPYYTACPNPWINDFIEEWEKEKVTKYDRDPNEEYHREPFTADVSEGKREPIYNVHTYHTKVPYKAIMRYLLHYTKPGDIILDGFSGSGMTGVAASMCNDLKQIEALGYNVDQEGKIYRDKQVISQLGKRKVILNDLSPMATFLSRNLNYPVPIKQVIQEGEEILNQTYEEFSWFFTTNHYNVETNEKHTCKVNYFVWSDVFVCNSCSNEIVFYEAATDKTTGKVKKTFNCPNCGVETTKSNLERAKVRVYDPNNNRTVSFSKQNLVLINYKFNDKSYNKIPDEEDFNLLKKIEEMPVNDWFPTDELPGGYNTKQPITSHGLTNVHHFYTKRILLILASLYNKIEKSKYASILKIWFTSQLINISKLNRYRPEVSFPYNPLNGTLYIGSQVSESNVFDAYRNKLNRFEAAFEKQGDYTVISSNSTTDLQIKENSIDYIFTDPPFGANIMYSELSFIWESWLKVHTNNETEAIINPVQQKGLRDYQRLMEESFKFYYKVLKPGRWITVEFSNSKASIWNAIQDAIQKAGFVIADVSALDKKQGSFKAVTTTIAVKQDLVITAYKPKNQNIEKMRQYQNTTESVWTFVDQHLEQLPIFIGHKGEAKLIAERTPRILFDRMVAYFIQNGLPVPISSAEFQAGLAQKYPIRDGMAFLDSQVAEYDKKRILVKEFAQQSLFVSDENSAIEWIRQQIYKKPQTRQELHPDFMKEIQHISKHEELPELDDLLEQNFLRYNGEEPVPNQILTYLRRNYKDLRGLDPTDPKVIEKAMHRWYVPDPNKQSDLEKLREKALLREFNQYKDELEGNKKKLRTFRTEAIRAGFKNAYKEKDFETIVKIGDRIPEKVIQEDDKLFMFYENAKIRLGL
ncbi:DNA methyltransferase [Pallidibacillus thermolactis]|uniref:DNA methyltransferase n=1 Tax=Pallidibacillus thermolactis TaxID=251051 RepID=UPI002E1CD18D|nr:DNA methyltransferase [Pallidibacillus thermolactis]MED1674297.1 DNA methyltransferase [Pallidibacillus thermolactis subsp. kokeshiiformis]